jgi:hypothetical protein
MEIVSIPLSGALEHQDSTGRKEVIRTGDVQIMSAGTGIMHSEKNASGTEPVHFLQIWVLPEKQDIAPRYEQKTFSLEGRRDTFQEVVSPEKDKASVWINQKAWFSLSHLSEWKKIVYPFHQKESLVYVFVLSGELKCENNTLYKRDAIGLWDQAEVSFEAVKETQLLVIEVPKVF